MQVTSNPPTLLLLGGNNTRGQTLVLALYSFGRAYVLFMTFLDEITY
jgi:hypothetical protein